MNVLVGVSAVAVVVWWCVEVLLLLLWVLVDRGVVLRFELLNTQWFEHLEVFEVGRSVVLHV